LEVIDMKSGLKNIIPLSVVLISIFSTAFSTSIGAQEETTPLPQVQSQGQAEFITGGVGKDESEAIAKAAGTWPLMLELSQSAVPRAEFISDVRITIKDKSGNTVLDMTSEGPYVLVKLPAEKYSLDATYESKTLHRNVSLQKGRSVRLSLIWPAGE
jgi:hypothetical protein